MVKLFKRKSQQEIREFKFETSLKIKSLPLEEYAHLTYAFQVAILRFERMLKESLLEGYITSTTLERISQELQLDNIRNLEIPDFPSLRSLFGEEAPIDLAKRPIPATERPIPVVGVTTPTPTPHITPEFISPTPSIEEEPKPVVEPKPSTPTITQDIPETRPTFSFSFPQAPEKPKQVTPSVTKAPAPSVAPKKAITPPTIPKISFPSTSKPAISPLAQSKGSREEDRATGIAILRKQMLTELKKIRSVVSEQER